MTGSRLNIIKVILSFGLILGFILWISENTLLLVSQSHSLPYRYFLLIKNVPLHKGDLVAIQHPALPEFKNVILTKRLVGLPGDSITLTKSALHINQEWQGPLQKKRSNGSPLTPIRFSAIPNEFVFVAGSHSNSFDSRYSEFGLVEERHILGRVYRLW